METGHALATPLALSGEVVRGFRRGGQLLGYPTANVHVAWANVADWHAVLTAGVYCGFAQLVLPSGLSPVYGMAMSLGTNPSFANKAMTLEVHLFHTFEEDFYGATLRVLVLHALRGMKTFSSLGLSPTTSTNNNKKPKTRQTSKTNLKCDRRSEGGDPRRLRERTDASGEPPGRCRELCSAI